ncbi:hypothetical protein ACFHW2_14380 [Actinomadura sp. LOL_016]|uniref:SCO3933 family regulatory protein n=1 Tax=unclassified Actinomadura TaxID=2626254 RepID=UPI003A801C11
MLTFVCVSPPRPKLVSQETGEVKMDRQGNTVFTVGLSVADSAGRVDLVNVAVAGDQEVGVGQIVAPVGLVAFPWNAVLGGERRSGVGSAPTASPGDRPGGVGGGLLVRLGRGLNGGRTR